MDFHETFLMNVTFAQFSGTQVFIFTLNSSSEEGHLKNLIRKF